MKMFKKILILVLLFLAAICATTYFVFPEFFDIKELWLGKHQNAASINNQVVIKERSITPPEGSLEFKTEFIPMSELKGYCPFQVSSNSTLNNVVVFQERYTGLVMGIAFIVAGDSVSLQLPPSDYRIKHIAGEIWEGESRFFGKSTRFFERKEDITNITSFDGCPEHQIMISDNDDALRPIKTLGLDLDIQKSRETLRKTESVIENQLSESALNAENGTGFDSGNGTGLNSNATISDPEQGPAHEQIDQGQNSIDPTIDPEVPAGDIVLDQSLDLAVEAESNQTGSREFNQ